MPPDNGGYMVAAYVVTAVILVGYAVMLVRRAGDRAGSRRSDRSSDPERSEGDHPTWSPSLRSG